MVLLSRILVVTLDTLAGRMAGPAIRAWEIARVLSAEHDVRLVTFGQCARQAEGFEVAHVDVAQFRAEVDAVDVVVVQGFVLRTFPWMQTCPQVIVVDLYDPFHLETLEVDRYRPRAERDHALGMALAELSAQVHRGDLFLCASRRQRDLWIGTLAAAGRINPDTYDADPTLTSLVAVVPFGTSAEAPAPARRAIRESTPGIGPDDQVVLWGGGVYNWFDPLTLIRAVRELAERMPGLRLYFLGMRHPNPDVPEMAVATRCRELSDELGLTGRHVFFNEDWVPYAERADFLCDADLGVSCHFPHVETEFSFRTRILDYLWAGLPIVATGGDAFAEIIDSRALGRTVPAEDVGALAEAIEAMLEPEAARAARGRVLAVAAEMTWPRVLEPLVEFCRNPHRSADAGRVVDVVGVGARRPGGPASWRRDAVSALRHLRAGGLRQVVAKVRWRLAGRR